MSYRVYWTLPTRQVWSKSLTLKSDNITICRWYSHVLTSWPHLHQEGQDLDLQFWDALGALHRLSKFISLPTWSSPFRLISGLTMLHCRIESFPFIYRGSPPLSRPPSSKRIDSPYSTELTKDWSLGRDIAISRSRLILANSVITSLPLYFMSFFFLSQWVIDQIDQLRRAFFWKGDRIGTGGQCLINWDVLCFSYQSRDLALGD